MSSNHDEDDKVTTAIYFFRLFGLIQPLYHVTTVIDSYYRYTDRTVIPNMRRRPHPFLVGHLNLKFTPRARTTTLYTTFQAVLERTTGDGHAKTIC